MFSKQVELDLLLILFGRILYKHTYMSGMFELEEVLVHVVSYCSDARHLCQIVLFYHGVEGALL